jgi:hypothetical protein
MSISRFPVLPKRRSVLRAATATGALLAIVGCSDGNSPDGEMCSSSVTFQVSSGTVPTFHWTPRCRLNWLVVSPLDSDQVLWGISSGAITGIASGVVYGVVPEGAVSTAPAQPLVSGTEYRVVGIRDAGAGLVNAGGTTFTP